MHQENVCPRDQVIRKTGILFDLQKEGAERRWGKDTDSGLKEVEAGHPA